MSAPDHPGSPRENSPVAPTDDLLAAVAALPVPALDELTEERMRRAARAVLDEEVARRDRIATSAIHRIWSRAVMPALVAATVCVYFGWAVRAASALYR